MNDDNKRIVGAIEAISAFLATRDAAHFRVADALRKAAFEPREQFQLAYCSAEWWGGAGSMVDFWPDDPSEIGRYQQMLIDLSEAVEIQGINCPAAVQRAARLRDFQRD